MSAGNGRGGGGAGNGRGGGGAGNGRGGGGGGGGNGRGGGAASSPFVLHRLPESPFGFRAPGAAAPAAAAAGNPFGPAAAGNPFGFGPPPAAAAAANPLGFGPAAAAAGNPFGFGPAAAAAVNFGPPPAGSLFGSGPPPAGNPFGVGGAPRALPLPGNDDPFRVRNFVAGSASAAGSASGSSSGGFSTPVRSSRASRASRNNNSNEEWNRQQRPGLIRRFGGGLRRVVGTPERYRAHPRPLDLGGNGARNERPPAPVDLVVRAPLIPGGLFPINEGERNSVDMDAFEQGEPVVVVTTRNGTQYAYRPATLQGSWQDKTMRRVPDTNELVAVFDMEEDRSVLQPGFFVHRATVHLLEPGEFIEGDPRPALQAAAIAAAAAAPAPAPAGAAGGGGAAALGAVPALLGAAAPAAAAGGAAGGAVAGGAAAAAAPNNEGRNRRSSRRSSRRRASSKRRSSRR